MIWERGAEYSEGEFWEPSRVAIDSSGNTYVAAGSNRRIQKSDPIGTFITSWNDPTIEMIFTDGISGIIRRYCRVRPE